MQIPAHIIPRDSYIDAIRSFMKKNIIKVFSGQRRVGKSYLLFQIIQIIEKEEPASNIIYINKEDLQFDFINNANDLNTYVLSRLKPDTKNYVFIDEIQDIPEFEKALRSLHLIQDVDLYITGSNAKMLSGELATYLSGRYIEFNIYSLSYTEFLQFHKLVDGDDSFELYMKFGGLPFLINLPLSDQAFEYLKSIYSTIIYRDVVARYNLRNVQFLEKLVLFLADNIGSLFSAKKISDFLKSQNINIGHIQIQQYSNYLANSFIIHEVNRMDIVGRKIFEIGSKFYFENTGIRNAICGYYAKDRGKLLENLVYNHLLFMGYDVKIGTVSSLEIDFVCERANERAYVQVALQLGEQATIEREFGNLQRINDNYPKIVVTTDQFKVDSHAGIRHMYIRDFLTLKIIQ
jgi:predicted AAA+ superfamily ATPase